MNDNYDIYGKYGCWWEGGTGVSPDGHQCGECYPNYEDKCPFLEKYRRGECCHGDKQIEETETLINNLKTLSQVSPVFSLPLMAAARKIEELVKENDRLLKEISDLEEELDALVVQEECDGRCLSCDLYNTSACPDNN